MLNDLKPSEEKLRKLSEILRTGKSMLVVLQDNPDPDAIATAVGLRELANKLFDIPCSITCGGSVGRAENRALLKYLNVNLRSPNEIDFHKFDFIAMVDTQPGTGNNSLPEDIVPHIVIDHHPVRKQTRSVPFTDIRKNYGATSTIMWEYLAASGIEIEIPITTALLYGIRSDTQDLGRQATQSDISAFLILYPMANQRMLSRIQHAEEPPEYFQMLSDSLRKARVYGRCVISDLGEINNADMIAEMADLLLRSENADWTLCYGRHGDRLLLSIRTDLTDRNAGEVMQRIVRRYGTGGGHSMVAGGQISLADRTKSEIRNIKSGIRRRCLRALKIPSARGGRFVNS